MSVLARRARMSGPAGFLPTSVAGLQLWLAADRITGLADGAAVATWADSSGNGRNATQATGANQPTYQTNEINGRPVVRFDGTNDQLVTTSYAAAQPVCVIVAVKSATTVGSHTAHSSAGNAPNLFISGAEWGMWAGSNVLGSATSSTNPTVFTGIANGASSKLRINGPTVTATGVDPGPDGISGGSIIGDNVATEWWNGDIAEVLVYKPVPADASLLAIERYLGVKYGIVVV